MHVEMYIMPESPVSTLISNSNLKNFCHACFSRVVKHKAASGPSTKMCSTHLDETLPASTHLNLK